MIEHTEKTKIILDTDIGSDIDDALCLAYLLEQPKCDLLGITTVTGEPVKRAMLASVLCKIAGKDIPIFPGAAKPLIIDQIQKKADQASRLKNWKYQKSFPKGEAVEFMRKTIRDNPDEVILLSIGPLTNIALLFKIDPEIPKLLKGMVSMAGAFKYRFPELSLREWNAYLDPHASQIVYNTKMKYHISIGQDVTCKIMMNEKDVKKKFTSELQKAVVDFSYVWFQKTDKIYFHDPLTAAIIFNKNICKYEKGKVDIEMKSDNLFGLTYWDNKFKNSWQEIAVDVNIPHFFKEYFSVFK
jgi:inosine-uridine nucleoside N-ribohydrolase